MPKGNCACGRPLFCVVGVIRAWDILGTILASWVRRLCIY